jgi:acetyl-CoA acetyltransferase
VTDLREVVICEPLRTPIGRFGGVLTDVRETMCIGGGQGLAAIFAAA